MQVLVLLLLPVLAAGTSFEVCKGREVALFHDGQQHMVCCGHHEAEVSSPEAQTCHCSHHHHHEQIHWLMDIGERPERPFVTTLVTVRPMPEPVMLLPRLRESGISVSVPPGRKLSPTGCYLLPLIC